VIGAGGLGALREAELRTAAALMGVSHVDVLDLVDSGMNGPAARDTLVGAAYDEVVARVRSCLEEFRPNLVVTLDGSDGHRDHERIRDATVSAVQSASWQVPRLYLSCIPVSLIERWVDHMSRQNPSMEHLQGDVPGTPDELITTVIDTSDYLPLRERAISAHASQASPFDGLPDDLRLDFLTVDRLRRIQPAWTGGPLEDDIFGSRGPR
jgi:LmbE family N-acetylglucosaminyl deacetylase